MMQSQADGIIAKVRTGGAAKFANGTTVDCYIVDSKYVVKFEDRRGFDRADLKSVSDELRELGVTTPQIFYIGKDGEHKHITIEEYIAGKPLGTHDAVSQFGDVLPPPLNKSRDELKRIAMDYNRAMANEIAKADGTVYDKFLRDIAICTSRGYYLDCCPWNFILTKTRGIALIDLPPRRGHNGEDLAHSKEFASGAMARIFSFFEEDEKIATQTIPQILQKCAQSARNAGVTQAQFISSLRLLTLKDIFKKSITQRDKEM